MGYGESERERVEEALGSIPDPPHSLLGEPTRFKLMNYLYNGVGVGHPTVVWLTGLTAGSVSKHLSKLEAAGMISSRRVKSTTRPRTEVFITSYGKVALDERWEWIEKVGRELYRGSV